MERFDSILDFTLVGYTKAGAAARGIDIHEAFPALRDRHVIVTGATGGIGRAVVERLASNGAVVHAVGRNPEKLATIKDETSGRVVTWQTDLSSMRDVSRFADEYVATGNPLHGLVHNVGVMVHERTITAEGFELAYATNLLGQYVLNQRLLPALRGTELPRVVLVSSGGMYSQALAADSPSTEEQHNGTNTYAWTKRGQLALAQEWATELAGDGIAVNAMHPGWADTVGVQDSLPAFRRAMRPLLRSAPQGADTIVWLVASEGAEVLTGRFVHDRKPRPFHRTQRTVESSSERQRFLDTLARDAAPYMSP